MLKCSLPEREEPAVIRRGGAPPGAAAFILTSDVWEQTTAPSAAALQTVPQDLHFLRIVLRKPAPHERGLPASGPLAGHGGAGGFSGKWCDAQMVPFRKRRNRIDPPRGRPSWGGGVHHNERRVVPVHASSHEYPHGHRPGTNAGPCPVRARMVFIAGMCALLRVPTSFLIRMDCE
jgi:hypothetical protein